MAVGDGLVDLQDVERFFRCNVIIYADDDFFFFVDRYLVFVGSFRDFALRVAALDGRDHAAHGVDFFDVVPCAALDFVREGFDKVRAAEGVDGVRDACFVRDDLLRAERDGGGELCRQRPGFVERIGVKRLRST